MKVYIEYKKKNWMLKYFWWLDLLKINWIVGVIIIIKNVVIVG